MERDSARRFGWGSRRGGEDSGLRKSRKQKLEKREEKNPTTLRMNGAPKIVLGRQARATLSRFQPKTGLTGIMFYEVDELDYVIIHLDL